MTQVRKPKRVEVHELNLEELMSLLWNMPTHAVVKVAGVGIHRVEVVGGGEEVALYTVELLRRLKDKH